MATKAITYLQAEGDVEACFAARGAHNLFLEGEAQRYAILGSIAGVSLVDGIKELEWPALAELVMPFVTLAADARGAGYGAVYIDDLAQTYISHNLFENIPCLLRKEKFPEIFLVWVLEG